MIIHAGHLAEGHELQARVCVVGAGPAGLSLADSLAAAGVDVLLLEAGDEGEPTDPLETVRNVGLPYPVPAKRDHGLGGSGRAWNLRTPLGEPYLRLRELDELDLLPRPGLREEAWPMTKAALQEDYRSAWALFGLPEAGPDEPGRAAGAETRVFRLGPAATVTQVLPRRLAASPRVRVVTGAVVTDVRTDTDAGTVSGLRCTSRSGTAFTARAEVYVLAGGGIENARLLLASRSRHPEGIGNASGHVGRYFMEHPHYASAVVRPADHRLDDDPGLWDFTAEHGTALQRKQALTRAATEREGVLSTAYYLVPRSPAAPLAVAADGRLHPQRTVALHEVRAAAEARRLPPHAPAVLKDALLAVPGAARYAVSQSRAARAVRHGDPHRAAPRVMTVEAMAEQVPNRLSRVRLTADRDAFGVPVAELDWRLTDTDWESMARSQVLLLPHLQALYGGRVDSLLEVKPRPWLSGGAHHMGTTRMTVSERDGVVDPDSRVHGTSNLYVTGSSVFPTGGSANPTLTVVALALRLGSHLRAELGAQVGLAD